MVGQMIDDLSMWCAYIMVFGAELIPSEMEDGVCWVMG